MLARPHLPPRTAATQADAAGPRRMLQSAGANPALFSRGATPAQLRHAQREVGEAYDKFREAIDLLARLKDDAHILPDHTGPPG